MSTLQNLVAACQADETQLRQQAQARTENWQPWLAPVNDASPTGEDPGYDDDFQRIREEVNKLSGIDTGLICTLAEKLLTTTAKDIRIATYYCWARLHQDGETGFAEGLELLAGLLQRYGTQLHPQRERSRKPALEWLAGSRVLDSLSLWPEVVRDDALRTAGALLLIRDSLEPEPEASRPELNALYSALESRLMKAGGVDAVVPQNAGNKAQSQTSTHTTEPDAPVLSRITSGQDLLAQARTLTGYLREQPDGWLAAHRLMKSLRHDTLSAIPAPDAEGKTRIEPPRADQRAMLKRLYLQQSWLEILEQADNTFSRGANHLWLDLQWYIHQALMKSGQDVLADIITADLKGLLRRLTGFDVGKEAVKTLTTIIVYAMCVNVFFFVLELFTAFYSNIPGHMEPIHVLFFGHGGHLLWVSYWMWAAVIMAFGCLAILIPPKLRTHPTLMPIALAMLVAASWIDKGLGLLIGGFTPNMFEAITPYMPTGKEIAVALGVYAVGALVVSLLWRIALGVKKEVNHFSD